MFKSLLATTLLLSVSSFSCAELTFSEKIRPTVQSLVNPQIDRLAIPPTPNQMSLPSFGKGVIGWGSGPEGAQQRLDTITATDVLELKTKGVTLEMVQTWQKFYENETRRNAGNPTAPLRAALMQKITTLW